MAYITPHKRYQLKGADRSAPTPSPVPSSLIPRFKETLNLGPSRRRRDSQGSRKIIYAAGSISLWFPVGTASNGDLNPASFRLKPFDCEIVEERDGKKPLVLVGSGVSEEYTTEGQDIPPWMSITERIVPDLIAAALGARNELKRAGNELSKLSFIARSGKNFFHGDSSISLNSIRKAVARQSYSNNKLWKSFYTNVPSAYMENFKTSVAPKIGFTFHSEKEHYHVKVSDKLKPDVTITCKCKVTENRHIEIYKMEGNPARHLTADISCLYKDLDMRLLLVTKKIMKIIDNEENDAMKELVRSAVTDSDMKGGLRWSRRKNPTAERFSVAAFWHTKYTAFKSDTMKIKLRHADRFDRTNLTGEISTEASLKLSEITRHLKEGDLETRALKEMVQEAVKLFWDHFLRTPYTI